MRTSLSFCGVLLLNIESICFILTRSLQTSFSLIAPPRPAHVNFPLLIKGVVVGGSKSHTPRIEMNNICFTRSQGENNNQV